MCPIYKLNPIIGMCAKEKPVYTGFCILCDSRHSLGFLGCVPATSVLLVPSVCHGVCSSAVPAHSCVYVCGSCPIPPHVLPCILALLAVSPVHTSVPFIHQAGDHTGLGSTPALLSGCCCCPTSLWLTLFSSDS